MTKRKEEYRKLLIELYKENVKLLDQLIFGISSLAFPFLFDVLSIDNLKLTSKIFLIIALFGFCFVIALQIISITTAREGCDNALSKDKVKQTFANTQFKKAKKFDKYQIYCFVFSTFLTAVGITFNLM